jgi:hypothetical protein
VGAGAIDGKVVFGDGFEALLGGRVRAWRGALLGRLVGRHGDGWTEEMGSVKWTSYLLYVCALQFALR